MNATDESLGAGNETPVDVLVCRSKLDPGVWFVYASGADNDLSDFEHPGRLRAVRRWAAEKYAGQATSARWVRLDSDTFQLVLGRSGRAR